MVSDVNRMLADWIVFLVRARLREFRESIDVVPLGCCDIASLVSPKDSFWLEFYEQGSRKVSSTRFEESIGNFCVSIPEGRRQVLQFSLEDLCSFLQQGASVELGAQALMASLVVTYWYPSDYGDTELPLMSDLEMFRGKFDAIVESLKGYHPKFPVFWDLGDGKVTMVAENDEAGTLDTIPDDFASEDPLSKAKIMDDPNVAEGEVRFPHGIPWTRLRSCLDEIFVGIPARYDGRFARFRPKRHPELIAGIRVRAFLDILPPKSVS